MRVNIVVKLLRLRYPSSSAVCVMAFRIGGKEFLIVCKSQTEEEAIGFFEPIRCGLKDAAIPHSGNGGEKVITASLGLAPFGGRAIRTLFEVADLALYRSKSSGRNQMTVAHLLSFNYSCQGTLEPYH